ncbi:DUF4174 domain-containing protein [Agarivorans sp. MS3-6]
MRLLVMILLSILPMWLHAFPTSGEYRSHRSILFFAPQVDQHVEQFMADELRHRCQIDEREVVILVVAGEQSINPSRALSRQGIRYLREKYQIEDRRHVAVLVGKDGYEKHRWGAFTNWQEVFTIIDNMPMRQQEIAQASSACFT